MVYPRFGKFYMTAEVDNYTLTFKRFHSQKIGDSFMDNKFQKLVFALGYVDARYIVGFIPGKSSI